MKKIGLIGFVLAFLLSGCVLPRVSALIKTATPIPGHTASGATASPAPIKTAFPSPSPSLLPTIDGSAETATPSLIDTSIPLPLTPLPTFDVGQAHPIPRQSPAICPKINPNIDIPKDYNINQFNDTILAYLNAGGDPQVFEKNPDLLLGGAYMDVTGDGVKEIIFGSDQYAGTFHVSLCQNGHYQLNSFEIPNGNLAEFVRFEKPKDLNHNGVPELMMESVNFQHGYQGICIYEWDGLKTFHLIISPNCLYTSHPYAIKDINQDGLAEIIVEDDVYDVASYREYDALVFKKINILGWNGEKYVVVSNEFQPPAYRFQATQLGDYHTFLGQYEQALAYYQQAISDETLKWWTDERVLYEYNINNYFYEDPSTVPAPVPDSTEYPKLAAYATYRMMILYTYLGQVDAAGSAYATLQSQYPTDNPGFPYAKMASEFWQTYLTTGRIASACQNSLEYVKDRPKMLDALGQAKGHGPVLIDYQFSKRPYLCPFPLVNGNTSIAVIATPAPVWPARVCLPENPATKAQFPSDRDITADDILRYLNAGGALNFFTKHPALLFGGNMVDLTGDGIRDILLPTSRGRFNFIGCKDGQYQLMPFYFGVQTSSLAFLNQIIDLNRNHIPELIFTDVNNRLHYTSIYIYEWDGVTFRSLIQVSPDPFYPDQITDSANTTRPYSVNGLNNIVILDDRLTVQYKGTKPARNETITLGWNGRYYINLKPGNYDGSKYRFQVITDADRLALYGNSLKALKLYNQAISDETLLGWSRALGNQPDFGTKSTSYQLMMGYVYFRILTLYMQMGDMDAATRIYQVMQEKFKTTEDSEYPKGHPYLEMATDFWNKYFATGGSLSTACSTAMFFADAHPEILKPLGSDYHGEQSHIYTPADVCLFW